jgi:GxxExxY protein
MELDEINTITEAVVTSAIKVHRAFGPGILESAYEKCLVHELFKLGLVVERQVVLPLIYDGVVIDAGYRLDLLVAKTVIVEIKAIEALLPIHRAQLLCYLRLTGLRVGLLINFNVYRLVDGIKRVILD